VATLECNGLEVETKLARPAPRMIELQWHGSAGNVRILLAVFAALRIAEVIGMNWAITFTGAAETH